MIIFIFFFFAIFFTPRTDRSFQPWFEISFFFLFFFLFTLCSGLPLAYWLKCFLSWFFVIIFIFVDFLLSFSSFFDQSNRSRSITNEINYCLCYRSVFNIKIFIYKIYYSILHSISEFKSVNETKAKCDLF